MMYQDKVVYIVGAARSGIAAARFLASHGAKVTLSDGKSGSALDAARKQLEGVAITWEEGGNRPETAAAADLVVVSPGVPRENTALQAAVAAGKEVIGEVELAFRHLRAPLVALTGSNGKSTTTVLTAEILKASGKKIFVGGNLGTPLIEATKQDYDVVVAEISSFQLEWIRQFRPHVAGFLNLSPNHLDRHASMEEYRDQKLRIFENQTSDDFAVFFADDPVVAASVSALQAPKKLSFSRNQETAHAMLRNGRLCLQLGSTTEQYERELLQLEGAHNEQNALAALLMARAAGATPEGARLALTSARALPHRLEPIRTVAGVRYINDSKATSVDATRCALEAFSPETKLILLAGGKDKGASYKPLFSLLQSRCRGAVFYGQARPLLARDLAGSTEIHLAENLADALQAARVIAQPQDVVLLAPACSSYDQYPNFEVRGDHFRTLVERLS